MASQLPIIGKWDTYSFEKDGSPVVDNIMYEFRDDGSVTCSDLDEPHGKSITGSYSLRQNQDLILMFPEKTPSIMHILSIDSEIIMVVSPEDQKAEFHRIH